MKNIKDVVIIGDGVAAKILAFTLYKKHNLVSTVISSEEFVPRCSTRSTAINCLRGTQKNVSSLGDVIVDSYNDFVNFYDTYQPQGIEKSFEIQLWNRDHEKWSKRFKNTNNYDFIPNLKNKLNRSYDGFKSEAFLICPELFFEWLDSHYEKEHLTDYVVDISRETNWLIITQSGKEIITKNVILCTSYETELFSKIIREEKLKQTLERSKPVSGTYLRFDINDFKKDQFNSSQAFSLAFNNIHFIYRPFAQDVLIGSTSINNVKSFLPQRNQINEIYFEIKKLLENAIDLPPIEKASMVVGVRHKGQKRTPFWGEINENCYGVWGLYKNGWSFAFKAALEISKAIKTL